MLDELLDFIIPHYCRLCGQFGTVLCESCKYDITSDASNHCLKCGVVISDHCHVCRMPYSRSWQALYRDDSIGVLISDYKYRSVRALHKSLAYILASRTPVIPPGTVIVPIPTIRPHIRVRGFDHTALFAKHFAKLKGCNYQPLLARATNTVQVGSSRAVRLRQMASAFQITQPISSSTPYLIVDDVYTTGATLDAAAKTLKNHGAQNIWVAVLARQQKAT